MKRFEFFSFILCFANPDKYYDMSHMNFRAKNVTNAIRDVLDILCLFNFFLRKNSFFEFLFVSFHT